MTLYTALSLPIVLIALAGDQDKPTPTSLRERLFREAPGGWRRLKEAERHIRGRLRYEASASDDGKEGSYGGFDTWYDFKRKDDLFRAVVTSRKHPGTIVNVDGLNYAFALTNPAGSDRLVLSNLVFGPPKQPDTYYEHSGRVPACLASPRSIWGKDLEEIIKDRDFQLKRISEADRGGKPIIRVDFTLRPTEKGGMELIDAWMELAPTEDWALQEAEYHDSNRVRTSITNEFRIDRSGRRRLSCFLMKDWFPKTRHEETRRFTLVEVEDCDAPDSEFTLSAFGFPEPGAPDISGYGGTMHYWLFGGAAALLGMAITMKWKARRMA